MIPENKIQVGEDTYECDVDPSLLPLIERHLCGSTKQDDAISAMPLPTGSPISKLSIVLIRKYQSSISPKLGKRCVMNPSCSHYAELTIRKHGTFKAIPKIIKRLLNCRSDKLTNNKHGI